MKTPDTFPQKVESLKAWRGVIYKSKSRGRDYFKLVYRNGGGRKTLGFESIDATMDGIQELLRTLGTAKADSLVLSGNEALQYRQAMEVLSELPKSVALNLALADYSRAKKVVGDASLFDAAQFYARRRGLNLPQRTVAEVVSEMLTAKRKEKLSPRYIKDLENRLTRFGKDCVCQIADLTGPTIAAWLRGLNLAPRTQNNFRTCIETLVAFAKSCGYLPRDWDELEAVSRLKDRNGSIEIFTPDEISKLLTHANKKLLAFVAIGAFAGLRSAELERLTWQKVDLKGGYITVDQDIAKTNSRRVIPIQPNLKKWLKPLCQKQGKVCAYGNVTNELLKLAVAAGITWKQNALRHSYASYRLAAIQDAAKVSLEMGNSPQMIFQHYRELVKPEQAKQWFAVKP